VPFADIPDIVKKCVVECLFDPPTEAVGFESGEGWGSVSLPWLCGFARR